MACFSAGTETLLAKANTVGSTNVSKLNYQGRAREPRIPTGHGRDTGKSSKYKSLILLALPREAPQPLIFNRLEPIREVWIHGEAFAASRLSMMRIMARRMNAATVVA